MTGAEKIRFTEAVEKMRDLQRASESVHYLDPSLKNKQKEAEKLVDGLLSDIRKKLNAQKQGSLWDQN